MYSVATTLLYSCTGLWPLRSFMLSDMSLYCSASRHLLHLIQPQYLMYFHYIVPDMFHIIWYNVTGCRRDLLEFFLQSVLWHTGTAVTQWLRCCATNWNVAGSIPAGVSGFFIDKKSFRSHFGPGVDSVSNGNEYQEYFLGVEVASA